MRQYAAGTPMTIVGDGTQRRDFTYIKDIVGANMAAFRVQDKDAYGEIFNVGTGTNYSINELAKMIGGQTKNLPPRPGEAHISLADTTKISKILKWKASHSLEQWVQEAVCAIDEN